MCRSNSFFEILWHDRLYCSICARKFGISHNHLDHFFLWVEASVAWTFDLHRRRCTCAKKKLMCIALPSQFRPGLCHQLVVLCVQRFPDVAVLPRTLAVEWFATAPSEWPRTFCHRNTYVTRPSIPTRISLRKEQVDGVFFFNKRKVVESRNTIQIFKVWTVLQQCTTAVCCSSLKPTPLRQAPLNET